MKAMLGIVLLLFISAMCFYWGGNSGQKEEPAYKDYRRYSRQQCTAGNVLGGDWEECAEIEAMIGPWPKLTLRMPRISFRTDAKVREQFPREVKNHNQGWGLEVFSSGWLKADKLSDGDRDREYVFFVSTLDGTVRLYYYDPTNEPVVQQFYVNVAKGTIRENDLLFLAETPYSHSMAYRRAKVKE